MNTVDFDPEKFSVDKYGNLIPKESIGKTSEEAPEQIVTISVVGGVAYVTSKSEGVRVCIRDYDVDGVSDDDILEDENGDRYVEG